MLIPACFRFQQTLVPAKLASSVGILKCLPNQFTVDSIDKLFCRGYSLPQYELLEVVGMIPPERILLELVTSNIDFWQAYLVTGSLTIFLPYPASLQDNRCLSFASEQGCVSTYLEPGYMRLLLIGYKCGELSTLLAEYSGLKELYRPAAQESLSDMVLPDVPIGAKLSAALAKISEISGSSYLLQHRLSMSLAELLHVFQDALKKEASSGVRSKITLYHMALEYIHNNYMQPIKIEDIAEALHISPRTLTRMFEGKTIKMSDYLQHARLSKAYDLLQEGNVSVDEIAFLLHFPNRRYFSREFKKFFAQSPSAVRRGDDFFDDGD